jgi:peptidoglycan pentaglycine glycine transferase (the first glycine)
MEKITNCIWTDETEDRNWDDFVGSMPDGHYEQSTSWARVREAHGWLAIRLKIERNGQICAGAQILFRKVSWIGKVGYIPYGPCIPAGSVDLTNAILTEIRNKSREERWSYVVMNLPSFGHHIVPFLKEYGYSPAMKELPPNILIASTLLMDLGKEPDEIFAGMKSKTRQNIRLGLREGLQMREGSRDDIGDFFRLMISTCERRKAQPLYPDMDSFYRFWDAFSEKGQVRLFFIDFQHEPVCAAFCFSFGQVLFMYQFGWSGEHAHLQPSKVLYWKTIEWARANGFRYCDFVSVDTEVAKAIENGLPVTEELKSKYFYGPTILKMSFGGTVVHLPGPYAYFPNVVLRVFSRTILRLILKQKLVMKAINALWAKQKKRIER